MVLAGNGVRDNVVKSWNVGNIRTEFKQEGRLASLTARHGVSDLEKGSCQGLLIGQDCELPAFQEMAEVANAGVQSCEFQVVR